MDGGGCRNWQIDGKCYTDGCRIDLIYRGRERVKVIRGDGKLKGSNSRPHIDLVGMILGYGVEGLGGVVRCIKLTVG